MYPEIFHIGSFPINTYGVFLALAFLCAILIAVRLAKRDGLPYEKIYDLSLWMLLAGLVGSKILMLFTEPDYRENPALLLSLAPGLYTAQVSSADGTTGSALIEIYEVP